MVKLNQLHPKIGTEIIIVAGTHSQVIISKYYNFYLGQDILLTLPYYFKVKGIILEVRSEIIGEFSLTRYRILFQFRTKEYIGWIHDYHAQLPT